ncbi:hypothetical protein [Pseudalkalibacillus caeni]|uniref:YtxH domain-containing protein n=1 Tax=Exobacillus caeni TaxID=2574798 RepID=A0A5R9F678_9BACL|nr:hypothetical protein [Pseudalkalibacillus caeni]TLS37846.1 hypothetical protein FCL54_08485 [Pseudalkalibacillus caeni]
MNKKGVVLSTVAVGTAGVTAYLMQDRKMRDKLVTQFYKLRQKVKPTKRQDRGLPVDRAGNPIPPDREYDSGDSKMVYEGSQFGVQYYNKLANKEKVEQARRAQENDDEGNHTSV